MCFFFFVSFSAKRQARAHGLADAETLVFAKVAAKSGLNVIFDAERAFGDGAISGNTIYVNPNNSEARTYEVILGHEMFHKLFADGDKRALQLFREARDLLERSNPEKAQEVRERYKKFYKKLGTDSSVAQAISEEEVAAAGAEAVFRSADAWAYILSKEPSFADKVLSFFRKSAREYSSVQGLSAQARKFVRQYKALFESLAERNQGNNALSIALEGAGAKKMPVTNTETDSMHVTGDNDEEAPATTNTDERYALPEALKSLGEYDATRIRHIESSGKDRVVRDYNEIKDFIKRSKSNPPFERLHIGIISDKTAALVKARTGEDITGYDFVLASNFVFHIYDSHGNEATEAPRGQKAVDDANIENIIEAVIAPDDVSLVSDSTGTALRFEKFLEGRNVAITITSTKKSTLTLKSAWIINEKSGGRTPSANANALAGTPEANSRSSTDNSITENAEKSNPSDENSSKNPPKKRFALTDDAYAAAIESGDMETLANYTQKQYNSFGWARANEVLSAKENERLRSLFADAVSKQANPPKTKSGEYMIAIGEDIDNKIAYMTGDIDNPVITRVLEIDEYNETKLDEIRRRVYATERTGIQRQAGGLFTLHTSTDSRFRYDQQRSDLQSQRYNDQFGTKRGTGSGTTQKAQRGIQGPYLKVVHTFTDITGRKRNVLKVSSNEYMIEGDARSKYKPTVEAAIKAENNRIVERYAREKDKSKSFVKAKLAANPDFLNGFRFALAEDEVVEHYTEKQYNSFGWARYAEALTKTELDDLYSKIQARTTLRTFKQSSKGEAIIEVNKKPHTTLDVDNVFVFVKGTKNNFEITKVVKFAAETETEMEIIKERLYERRSFSDTHLAFLEQQGFAAQYTRESSKTFDEYQRLQSSRKASRGTNQDNRGRTKYRSGYSLAIGEDGEITERYALTDEENWGDIIRNMSAELGTEFNINAVLERGFPRKPGAATLTIGEIKKTTGFNLNLFKISKAKEDALKFVHLPFSFVVMPKGATLGARGFGAKIFVCAPKLYKGTTRGSKRK